MNEEEDKMESFRTRITNWTRRFLIEIILILVLAAVIVIVAIQFMAPTIGNVFPEETSADYCLSHSYEGPCPLGRDQWQIGLPEERLRKKIFSSRYYKECCYQFEPSISERNKSGSLISYLFLLPLLVLVVYLAGKGIVKRRNKTSPK